MPPPAVVLANAAVGLVAAASRSPAATRSSRRVLLQVKTLLDNMDGQLARASGRVTLAGRYLDTVADLVVNAAVFAALGYVTGQPLLAAAVVRRAGARARRRLQRDRALPGDARDPDARSRRRRGVASSACLAAVYGALFAPLDRAVRSSRRGASTVRGSYDRFTVTVLANLGLTTQLAVLGVVPRARRAERVPLVRARLPRRARAAPAPGGAAARAALAS